MQVIYLNYLRDASILGVVVARSSLLRELDSASREYLASYVLFNQAVAGHVGIHPTDLQCLNLLSADPRPRTTGEIAELTGLTSGSATRLVDRLEGAGYVTRQRDESDKRQVKVRLRTEGLHRLRDVWDRLRTGWDTMFEDYTEMELELLVRHMRRTSELGRQQRARLNRGDL
ncbi:MAG TPA: MarR family transcriptional regulator [Mycobacteriales bacterium]|jgi:DNA-binding MarR family transcriptional regulator|nr:MarR family transcriptional regulator [Mycobacteriales bacterium]